MNHIDSSDLRTCPNCDGKGSDRWGKCITCEGIGKITAEDFEQGYCVTCGKAKNFINDPKGVCDNPDCPSFVEDEDEYWTHLR